MTRLQVLLLLFAATFWYDGATAFSSTRVFRVRSPAIITVASRQQTAKTTSLHYKASNVTADFCFDDHQATNPTTTTGIEDVISTAAAAAVLMEEWHEQHAALEAWMKEEQQEPSVSLWSASTAASCAAELVSSTDDTTTTTTTIDKTHKEPMSDVVKARLLLLGAAALYGTNFSLVKLLGETGMSVGLSSTLRFGMAALATLPWLLQVEPPPTTTTKQQQRRQSYDWQQLFNRDGVEFQSAMLGLEVGMWNSIGYVAQAVGLETTAASKSAFLCSLAVVMVPLLDYLAGKQLLSRQVLGAALAVVGVGFLELEGVSLGAGMESLSGGDIASLVQPIAFGLGFWKMEAAMAKFPNQASRATAAQLMAVFIGSAAYMASVGVLDPTTLPSTDQFVSWVTDPSILGALFWTGVVTTALTIYMETVALKTLSAAETTLIFSTEPLWGTAFASVVMGETMGVNAAVGAVMILFSCVFSTLGWNGMTAFVTGGGEQKKDAEATTSTSIANNNADAIKALNESTNLELEEGMEHRSYLPTKPLQKFSLKSSVAGVMTAVVAAVESASSSTASIVVPEELQELIDNLPK